METESSSLIKKKPGCIAKLTSCIKHIYWKSFCHSKGVIIIFLLYSAVSMSAPILTHAIEDLLITLKLKIVFKAVISSMLLFTPFLAYLGEKFNRYKVIRAGVVLILITYLCYTILLIVQITTGITQNKQYIEIMYIVFILPAICGNGLFTANIPQFGATQLQFGSSEQYAALARWAACIYLTSQTITDVTLSAIYPPTVKSTLAIVIASFVLLLFTSAIAYRFSHLLIIEPPPKIDGLTLMWRVVKFSRKNRHPIKRSAFTYNEDPPTRLDLAKERYGGPFTTKQVEEVKSFWHMIKIPISHIFNTAFFSSVVLGHEYFQCLQIDKMVDSLPDKLMLNYTTGLGEATAVIVVVVFQLVFVPFFPKFIPNILQRMWIGLLFLLLSSLSIMIISFNYAKFLPPIRNDSSYYNSTITDCSDKLWPPYMFIIPEMLVGIGLSINLVSQMEFLYAQVPHSMQSIFVGMINAQIIFPYMVTVIGKSTWVGKHWGFYTAISCIQIIVLASFTVMKRKYKYRLCNDPSDINIRSNIEDVFERDFNARDFKERDLLPTTDVAVCMINS